MGSQRSGEGISTPLDGSCFSRQETHKGQVGKPLGRTACFMPLNPSTAVAPHEQLASGEPLLLHVASEALRLTPQRYKGWGCSC
ncbi:MAG: hypothetical protein V7K21_28300 [Nostoc sp.]|uniref:hypothetical protein n=1 Tax=Nostoc sp. TaxID=1180 RepID=UPI002FFB8473